MEFRPGISKESEKARKRKKAKESEKAYVSKGANIFKDHIKIHVLRPFGCARRTSAIFMSRLCIFQIRNSNEY